MTQEIIMIISGIIIAIISGTFMAVMKRSWVKKANEDKKIDELEKSVHILQKSIWRLS